MQVIPKFANENQRGNARNDGKGVGGLEPLDPSRDETDTSGRLSSVY